MTPVRAISELSGPILRRKTAGEAFMPSPAPANSFRPHWITSAKVWRGFCLGAFSALTIFFSMREAVTGVS